MAFKNFTDFPVYQKSFHLLIQVYQLTKNFPLDERFNLISDIHRSANSIVHNIAEGFGRYSGKDKARFYMISRGSAYEIISQLLVSKALGYLPEKDEKTVASKYQSVIEELDKLIRSLENRGRN